VMIKDYGSSYAELEQAVIDPRGFALVRLDSTTLPALKDFTLPSADTYEWKENIRLQLQQHLQATLGKKHNSHFIVNTPNVRHTAGGTQFYDGAKGPAQLIHIDYHQMTHKDILTSFEFMQHAVNVDALKIHAKSEAQLLSEFTIKRAYNIWMPLDKKVMGCPLLMADKNYIENDQYSTFPVKFNGKDVNPGALFPPALKDYNLFLMRGEMSIEDAWLFDSFRTPHVAVCALGNGDRNSMEFRVLELIEDKKPAADVDVKHIGGSTSFIQKHRST